MPNEISIHIVSVPEKPIDTKGMTPSMAAKADRTNAAEAKAKVAVPGYVQRYPEPKKGFIPKLVTIEKTMSPEDGFIIKAKTESGETRQFIKGLAEAPTMIARIMGLKGTKSAADIRAGYKREED